MSILDDFMDAAPEAEKYENYVKIRCLNPDHEDRDPSFLVFEDGYYCLGCGWRGDDVEKLLGRLDHQVLFSAPATTKKPSIPRVEITEDFVYSAYRMLEIRPILGQYLQKRGIIDLRERFEIGWYEGWFTFPVREEDGSLQGIILRADEPTQERTGLRYVTPGQSSRRFVPDWSLLPDADELFIVFGTIDAVLLAGLGFPTATGSSGKSSFRAEWVENWRRPIYVIPDLGEEDTAYDLANSLGWRGRVVRLNYPKGYKDPADFAANGNTDELVVQLKGVTGGTSDEDIEEMLRLRNRGKAAQVPLRA